MRLLDVLDEARRRSDCVILPPTSQPHAHRSGEAVPADVLTFYKSCGGATFFAGTTSEVRILGPEQVVPANPVIVGDPGDDEPVSRSSYLIAQNGNGDFITVDMSFERGGRIYDSFYELHGVVGSWPVIAASFTTFIFDVWQTQGESLFWTSERHERSFPDAYGQ
jgi:hypothetical protein